MARWAALTEIERANVATPAGRVEYLAVPVTSGGETEGVFVAALFRDRLQDDYDATVLAAGATGLGVLLIGSLLAWRLAGRVVDPVTRLTRTARSISETDLSRRIPVQGRDEVAQQAATFNDMLDRLERAFEEQRRFVDDAGHQLRTPLTIVLGNLELLPEDATERQETVDLLTDELERMSRIVGDLLLLAKREQPGFLELATVDIGALTDELASKAAALAPREWIVEDRGQGMVVADRQRLTEAMLQLAENAVKHGGEHGAIRLGSSVSPDAGPSLGARRGRGRAAGGAGTDLRPLPARRERKWLGRFGPRPPDREGDRRGARRTRRARERAGAWDHLHDRYPRRPAGGRGADVSNILIAEDESRISAFLERGLTANGYTTEVAASGDKALELARTDRFDLVILDLGLPKMDGFEVLRELRAVNQRVPVVILTARENVRDTVAGFEGGADDYITKPFRFQELLARVRVRLRSERNTEATTIRVGDMKLDLRTKQVLVDGQTFDLSAREFAMAETFFRHPGQVLSRQQLLDLVWGYAFDPGSNIVDVYVGYLRRKLGKQRISSLRGMGYRLESKEQVAA